MTDVAYRDFDPEQDSEYSCEDCGKPLQRPGLCRECAGARRADAAYEERGQQ